MWCVESHRSTANPNRLAPVAVRAALLLLAVAGSAHAGITYNLWGCSSSEGTIEFPSNGAAGYCVDYSGKMPPYIENRVEHLSWGDCYQWCQCTPFCMAWSHWQARSTGATLPGNCRLYGDIFKARTCSASG